MSFSISGKTAIVTGAANGIGLAIARHFALRGANVMMADMDEAGLEAEVGDAEDGNTQFFAGDLRKNLTQANLLSATIDAFDQVDILVNASRQIMPSNVLDPKDKSLDCLLEQNVTAGYRLSQLIANRMIAQSEDNDQEDGTVGSIINISSIAAQRAHPDLLAYSVSTAALNQLTRTLALALAPQRIRVNAVAFGSIMSASLRSVIADHEAARAQITDNTPLGRIASPSELAETVQFLASDASDFITGEIITLDGGRTLVDGLDMAVH